LSVAATSLWNCCLVAFFSLSFSIILSVLSAAPRSYRAMPQAGQDASTKPSCVPPHRTTVTDSILVTAIYGSQISSSQSHAVVFNLNVFFWSTDRAAIYSESSIRAAAEIQVRWRPPECGLVPCSHILGRADCLK
jgi:hypothetical protein